MTRERVARALEEDPIMYYILNDYPMRKFKQNHNIGPAEIKILFSIHVANQNGVLPSLKQVHDPFVYQHRYYITQNSIKNIESKNLIQYEKIGNRHAYTLTEYGKSIIKEYYRLIDFKAAMYISDGLHKRGAITMRRYENWKETQQAKKFEESKVKNAKSNFHKGKLK